MSPRDELRRLLAGATAAPWQWLDSGGDPGERDELQDGHGEMVATEFRDDLLPEVTDGRLCAVMRNELPGLLDDLDALRTALQRLIKDVDPLDWEQGICDWCGGGWEDVPGPRGGRPKHKHTGQHRPGCPFTAAQNALTALATGDEQP